MYWMAIQSGSMQTGIYETKGELSSLCAQLEYWNIGNTLAL